MSAIFWFLSITSTIFLFMFFDFTSVSPLQTVTALKCSPVENHCSSPLSRRYSIIKICKLPKMGKVIPGLWKWIFASLKCYLQFAIYLNIFTTSFHVFKSQFKNIDHFILMQREMRKKLRRHNFFLENIVFLRNSKFFLIGI